MQEGSFLLSRNFRLLGKPTNMASLKRFVSSGLSHSVYQRWKRQFNAGGASLLKPQYHKIDPELRALQEENARLKKIIGNQALELEFKTELLKKSDAHERRRKGL